MKRNIFILESLLKVFDANYASEEQANMIEGLDINDSHNLKLACDLLLKEDFLSYTEKEKKDFLVTMEQFLAIDDYSFDELLDGLSFIFYKKIKDNRVFIYNVKNIVAQYMNL